MRVFATLIMLTLPPFAYANVGLPMLAVIWPLSLPSIVPVIIIESWYVRRRLNTSWKTAFIQMTKANVFSTAIGIPIAWILAVIVEFSLAYLLRQSGFDPFIQHGKVGEVLRILLVAPWLGPFREGGYWIVPFATAVLLVPFYFASAIFEAWYVAVNFSNVEVLDARRAIWRANLVSYALLMMACLVWLVISIYRHG